MGALIITGLLCTVTDIVFCFVLVCSCSCSYSSVWMASDNTETRGTGKQSINNMVECGA